MTNKEFETDQVDPLYMQHYCETVSRLHSTYIAQGKSFTESKDLAVGQTQHLLVKKGIPFQTIDKE